MMTNLERNHDNNVDDDATRNNDDDVEEKIVSTTTMTGPNGGDRDDCGQDDDTDEEAAVSSSCIQNNNTNDDDDNNNSHHHTNEDQVEAPTASAAAATAAATSADIQLLPDERDVNQRVKQELRHLHQQQQSLLDCEDFLQDIMPLPMSMPPDNNSGIVTKEGPSSSSRCDAIRFLKGLHPHDRQYLERSLIQSSRRGDGNVGAFAQAPQDFLDEEILVLQEEEEDDTAAGTATTTTTAAATTNEREDNERRQEEGLVQARIVNDDHVSQVAIMEAPRQQQPPELSSINILEESDRMEERDGRKDSYKVCCNRYLVFVGGLGLLFLVITLGVLLGIRFDYNTNNHGNDPRMKEKMDDSKNITMLDDPMDIPQIDFDVVPLPQFTWDAILKDNKSPQALAYEWLLKDPNLHQLLPSQSVQRMALATLYYATNGHKWTINQHWLYYNVHECHWFSKVIATTDTPMDFFVSALSNQSANNEGYNLHELVCDENGNYNALVMPSNELQGPLPPELALLTHLELLDLTNNPLRGSLPSQLGLLTSLREFNLGRTISGTPNYLTGSLPSSLGLLTNLEYFFIANAQFTGTLPSELGKLKKIKQFLLNASHKTPKFFPGTFKMDGMFVSSSSGITENIPTEIYQWTHARHVHLLGNDFTGSIGSGIGNLKKLQSFVVLGNSLTGTLPKEVFSLSKLTFLDLSMNMLTGTIHTEVAHLSQLKQLYLGMGNMLSGTIPSELGLCTELSGLSLSENRLSGTVPQGVYQMSLLTHLNLEENPSLIGGSIPNELGLATNLKWLLLGNSNFKGSLPASLVAITALEYLDLQGNSLLTGSLPFTSFSNSTLAAVKINNTGLTGTLPYAVCRARHLWFDCPKACGCGCFCNP